LIILPLSPLCAAASKREAQIAAISSGGEVAVLGGRRGRQDRVVGAARSAIGLFGPQPSADVAG